MSFIKINATANTYVSTVSSSGALTSMYVQEPKTLVRPVINLRADVVFKQGTDGSKNTPYELAN